MKKHTGKNVRISDDTYDFIRLNLPPHIKISKFAEQAIYEKIQRDMKTEKLQYLEPYKDTNPTTNSH
jgi:hypothetical protein